MNINLSTVVVAVVLSSLAFAPQAAQAQNFAPVQTNPFSLTAIGNNSAPTFADLDNDGDMDLLAGEGNGDFFYFENLVPTAAAVQTNPFSLTNIGTYSKPTFADLDNDGDMDLLSGDQYGNFYYLENTTTVGIDKNVSVYPNPNNGMVNVAL